MRRMSFSMTEQQLLDGSKTVTRRLGWEYIQAGEQVLAVDRVMGLRKGERQRILGVIDVRSVRREPLDTITDDDVAREGFPGKSAGEFVSMFCKAMQCQPADPVTRIEFVFRRLQD